MDEVNMVKVEKNDVFTDSMVIAEGTGNQHKSVMSLIRRYRENLEKLGKIEFSDLKSLNPWTSATARGR